MANSADDSQLVLLHRIADIEEIELDELAEQITRVWGHEPISDRMAPRYRRAISAYNECSSLDEFLAVPPDTRGDLKGIFTRVAKRDQWDWMHVQIGLGLKRRECGSISHAMSQLTKSSTDEERKELFSKIESENVREGLSALLDHIEDSHQGLKSPLRTRSAAQPKLERNTQINFGPILQKISEAAKLHERTEDILVDFLSSAGFRCERNVYLDVFARLKSGPAMFEVKSINDFNERSQTRKAVAQLLEYRFLHSFDDPSLWIVFSRKPKDLKMCVEFPNSLNLNVIWLELDQFAGPNSEDLLRSPGFKKTDASPRGRNVTSSP